MLRITPQQDPEAAKRYQAEHLSRGDYYLRESENYGHWLGKGSQMLGLQEGSIIFKTDYDRLCENKRPSDGKKLTIRNKSNRRVAYDFTFSVPKDISVLAYTTNDERIIDAFHESCRYTMREVEKDACVRMRKEGADGDRSSGNLIIAEFRHDTSRPVGSSVPDPHLHAHYLVFNASFDPVEKQFKAVQFGELKTDGSYYQEIQINRFVQSLNRIGYKVVASPNGFYRLEGLPDSVSNKFSKRSAQIEQGIAERGLAKGSKLAKEVTLETRQRKMKGLSRDDLVKEWKAAIDPEDWVAMEKVRKSATTPTLIEGIVLEDTITEAINHCFERRSVVRDKQILTAALKVGRGEVDLELLKQELIVRQNDGQLLRDAITFHRATQGFERHEVVKVLKRQNDFLLVQHPTGKPTLFNPNVQSAFDVGTIVQIAVARREKLLIQGNLLSSKLVNGESVEVKDFYSDGYLALADGRIIPSTFRQFTYGYANTSHTSQGKTVDRGILILGPDAIEVAGLRQGYVSNSRFQYTQAIYTTNLEAAKEALAMRKERKLAHDLKLREQGIVKTAIQQSELNIKKEKRWHFGLKI